VLGLTQKTKGNQDSHMGSVVKLSIEFLLHMGWAIASNLGTLLGHDKETIHATN